MNNNLPPSSLEERLLYLAMATSEQRWSYLAVQLPDQLIEFLRDENIRGEVLLHLKNFIMKQALQSTTASTYYYVEISRNTRGENRVNLALQLWSSYQTASILLLEITAVHRSFLTLTFTTAESTRVCNALAVLQGTTYIPFYVDPLLRIQTNENRDHASVRLSSLDLVGALAKFDDPQGPEILNFFLGSGLVLSCLHCMGDGDTLTGKATTLIVMNILMQEAGLNYCCDSPERVQLLVQVLRQMVEKLTGNPSLQTLKYVVQCYYCLSGKSKLSGVLNALRDNFPRQLTDTTFRNLFSRDPEMQDMMEDILLGR
ncbi:uncharacterized protein LOC132066382 [Lycium ferocissimum]|uniref:uncharacterized protein LOC132066382 n=1 Tax=Lycium ferocissimum TaxID=112874 RepID=UPI0028169A1F|nr:uncharacterized protein LOC132066382 [Lycium ferocissimum]